MLLPWLRHAFCRAARRSPPIPRTAGKRLRPFRPAVEPLERRIVPVIDGFNIPFPPNSAAIPRDQVATDGGTDDGNSGEVQLGFTANFFGTNYSTVFVNNNGNLTFGGPSDVFTPTGLQAAVTSSGKKIIAPFFADVDTRDFNGTQSGRTTFNTATGVQYPNSNQVFRAFGATWFQVGYFDNTKIDTSSGGVAHAHANLTNTFQVILYDRSDTGQGNFDIVFNYDMIEWETGDASGGVNGLGGTSAYVGYSDGTAANTFQLDGSGVPGSFLGSNANTGLPNTTNLSPAVYGTYLFKVRNGAVTAPPAITSGSAAAFAVGTPGTFTVRAVGLPLPQLTQTGALPTGVTFHDNGNGTATLSGTPAAGTLGSYPITITAHNGAGADAVQTLTLTVAQPATHFLVQAPPGVTPGGPFSVTVRALDGQGNPGYYVGTIHFTSTAAGQLPADYTFQASDAGSHAFAGVVLNTTGSQTVTATDTAAS
jgi:hypothetical protein